MTLPAAGAEEITFYDARAERAARKNCALGPCSEGCTPYPIPHTPYHIPLCLAAAAGWLYPIPREGPGGAHPALPHTPIPLARGANHARRCHCLKESLASTVNECRVIGNGGSEGAVMAQTCTRSRTRMMPTSSEDGAHPSHPAALRRRAPEGSACQTAAPPADLAGLASTDTQPGVGRKL